MTSGTSYGHGVNNLTFHVFGLPQRSIFQQLDDANITWVNYYNSSFNPDADFYEWTYTSGRSETHVQPIARFFADAKAGTLPQFTWINPEVGAASRPRRLSLNGLCSFSYPVLFIRLDASS